MLVVVRKWGQKYHDGRTLVMKDRGDNGVCDGCWELMMVVQRRDCNDSSGTER